jgi:hypothetical protein
MYTKLKSLFSTISPELFIWTSGLLLIAFIPFGNAHFSVCPLNNLGLSFCPGCGLGNSLHHLFHMDISGSFNSHPLGIPALLIILTRILTLTKNSLTHNSFLKQRSSNGQRISTDAESRF